MRAYIVNLHKGMYLITAKNIKSAKYKALCEEGYYNVINVKRATTTDREWVRAMGGVVPEALYDK